VRDLPDSSLFVQHTITALGTEILKQGVERKFLFHSDIAVPHGDGEFRVPRPSMRETAAPVKQLADTRE
jgi:hypothetical protein